MARIILFLLLPLMLFGQKIKWKDFTTQVRDSIATKTTMRAEIGDSIATSYEVILPDTIYCAAGVETNIYWDNIVKFPNPSLLWYNVTCDSGAQDERRWFWTPGSSTNGNFDLTLKINNPFTLNDETTHSTKLIVNNSNHYFNDSLKLLIVGDSWTTQLGNLYTDTLLNIFDLTDTGLDTLICLGTQGAGTSLHEGYSGKYYEWFYKDASSPFTNGGVFDFGNYCASTISDTPAVVIFELGINDLINKTDAVMPDTIAAIMGYIEAMTDSMDNINSNMIFGVTQCVPVSSQDGFGSSYNAGADFWQYEKNRFQFNDSLKNHNFSTNVHIIPVVGLDRKYNFRLTATAYNARNPNTYDKHSNGVHPDSAGYWQLADIFYSFLKNQRIGSENVDGYVLAYYRANISSHFSTTNDSIDTWLDGSNNFDMSQSTVTKRPVFNSDSMTVIFDGTDDYLSRTAAQSSALIFDETEDITIEWYGRNEGTGSVHTIWANGRRAINGMILYYNAALDKVYLYIGSSSNIWTSQDLDSYTYGCIVLDSNGSEWQTAELFVDNVSQGSKDVSSQEINNGSEGVSIGCNRATSSPQDFFNGKIKEIRISNTLRDSTARDAYMNTLNANY